MAKKMIINCGKCDARNVSEATLSAYESIVINSSAVLVTSESKDLLNRYGVKLNCGDLLELDRDVVLSSGNGTYQIKSSDAPVAKTYLLVNGSLEIGADTQKVLSQYVGIHVNGSVTYPESVSGCLSMLRINGSTNCYPDGAIVLKRNAVIDRLFALRAKERLYWSGKRMIMVDELLDGEALARKGATFSAKEVILAESKVERMIELIDEQAEIIVVPDGTAVITDDLELNELTVKKYGTKLYVLGDLKVIQDEKGILDRMEYLRVCGDVSVTAELKEKIMEALTEIDGTVHVVRMPKGRHIEDKMKLRISKWLLEQEHDGIHASDCMKVVLDDDIPNDMILERLSFSDCMEIKCTPEQESAVAAVSEDVLSIGGLGMTLKDAMGMEDEGADGMGIGDMVKGALGIAKDAINTKIVNAGDYVL